MSRMIYTAETIFDGQTEYRNACLIVEHGKVMAIVSKADMPVDVKVHDLGTGLIAPGFVDLQVNGGGGVMLNDGPSVEIIETICAAHRSYGTTSLLPTLITDTPENSDKAIAAAIAAGESMVAGFAGLHLEGPHLSRKRNGAHDPDLIRPMTDDDLRKLLAAKDRLETLLTTVAPESVSVSQIATLANAGIIVSLGHSDCDYETAMRCFDAGATMATHLFNAMSQIGNREPGLAGAAINCETVNAGLIADGFHVHPATMKMALNGKTGPGGIFLVTDAMSTVGSGISGFKLNGREILRHGGRLTLEDGTLAGADIDMMSCVRFVNGQLGVDKMHALAMASMVPARAISRTGDIGRLAKGCKADFVHVNDDCQLVGVYSLQ